MCQFFTWRLLLRDGVYYADGRGCKFDLGKHSLGTRNHKEAVARLRQLDQRKAFELGMTDAKSDTANSINSITVTDGWKRYLDFSGRSQVMGGISANSLKRYRAVRDKHIDYCARHGITTWAEFGKPQLENYGNRLGKNHADRTVFLELTLLKSVVKWLVTNGHLPAGYELRYPLRKPQGTDTYCYRPEEVAAMVKHCQSQPKLNWLAHAIFALAHTGLRIGELANLRWTDVNLNQNVVRVADERASQRKRHAGTARTTKGRRSRTVPIHPDFKKLLVPMERHSDGYIFRAAQGGKLHERNVLQMFIDNVIRPLAKKFPTPDGEIGFEHGRLHSFRHFFCSQAFLGGASEGEIKEWLGHADSKMVELYRHLRSEDAQRKMERIEFLGRSDSRPGEVA